MSFLSPLFLLGALAVGVPIWVHLIRRQQSEPMRLPSLMFFRKLPVRTLSRQQLHHLLLLAARCLLILLLALAFARPFFPWMTKASAIGPKSQLYVVMVDVSASMKYGDRAQKAQAAARDALSKMGRLDAAQVIAFDSEARILGPASSDRGILNTLVNTDLAPGAGGTRYAAAFTALDKVARAAQLPVASFLITDAQKSGWSAGSQPPSLPPGSTLQWIAVDDRAHANYAVTDVHVTHDTYQSRYPQRIQVRVSGYGAAAAKKDVVFSLNGRELQRRKVDIPLNGAANVTFDPFDLPLGLSRGEIRITPADDFPSDDVRYFTVQRREPHKILFLSSGADRPLLYLKQALSASDDPAFEVDARSSTQGSPNLAAYSMVVLFNTPSLPAGLASSLKDYVQKGGGLLIAPGDRTEWSSLAGPLATLMPASGGDKVYIQRDREGFLTIGDFRKDHPLFQPFTGAAAESISAAHVFGYFRLKADGNVLARLSNGDPAVVEKVAGKGRVLLFAAPPDNVWCDLPVRPAFVPLMNQAARYLSQMQDDPAYYTVPSIAAVGEGAVVIDPHGKRQYEELQQGPAFAKLAETGFYEVRRQGQTTYIAANSDPRESDLTPLSSEDRELLGGKPSEGAATTAATQPETPTREDLEKRQSLWWPVLLIAALLVAVESIAANDLFKLNTD